MRGEPFLCVTWKLLKVFFFLLPFYFRSENVRDLRISYIIAHINLCLNSEQRDLEVEKFSHDRNKWTLKTEYD